MITYLTFEIILHNRHDSFYVELLLVKGTGHKENKEKMKQTQQPSYSSHQNKGAEDITK